MKKRGFFEGEVVTEWLDDGRLMVLRSEFRYVDLRRELVWVALPGLIFDGASIPRAAWSIIGGPFAGKHRRAALLHDQYCQLGRAGKSPYPSSLVHAVFYDMLLVEGTPRWRAVLVAGAARLFGPRFKGAK